MQISCNTYALFEKAFFVLQNLKFISFNAKKAKFASSLLKFSTKALFGENRKANANTKKNRNQY